jgi:tRNA dimethylallyltransferase
MIPSICLVGPTASGKTALAHEIFMKLETMSDIQPVLVNIDAFQIYKELNIGTSKPNNLWQQHYIGLDMVSMFDTLDANTFIQTINHKLLGLQKQTPGLLIPIVVGGSGLYQRAYIHGLDALPSRNEGLRNYFATQEAGNPGWSYKTLQAMNPGRAAVLHPNDKVRIERALELAYLNEQTADDTGALPMQNTRHGKLESQAMTAEHFIIRLHPDKMWLENRIQETVQGFFDQGWVAEVANLLEIHGPDCQDSWGFRAIGYKQIAAHILQHAPQGSISKNLRSQEQNFRQITQDIVVKTRQLAKKQNTWFATEKYDVMVGEDLMLPWQAMNAFIQHVRLHTFF